MPSPLFYQRPPQPGCKKTYKQDEILLPAATKLWPRKCFHRCLSVHRGEGCLPQCMLGSQNPPDQADPAGTRQTPPPGTWQTPPPRTRQTPPGPGRHPPGPGRHHPPEPGRPPPPGTRQTPPDQADTTPPGPGRHPPGKQTPAYSLLECILVYLQNAIKA